MKTWWMALAVVLGLVVAVVAQQVVPVVPAPKSKATPGHPETVVVMTQSRDEVRMRDLERDILSLQLQVQGLQKRVEALEAATAGKTVEAK